MPEKFDPIIAVIEETKDISKLSFQELMGSLKSFEQRLSRHSEKAVESAFQSKLSLESRNSDKKPSASMQAKNEPFRGGRTSRGRSKN